MISNKKTAREIKVDSKLLANKNINVKIGTVENREAPETIYIFMSFWLKPKTKYQSEDSEGLKNLLNKELQKIYNNSLKPLLEKNNIFPREKENIFIINIPDNFNYNQKKNFISIELYLHTCNIFKQTKLPISNKKNTELFDEAIKLTNIISSTDILKSKSMFDISKTSA